MYKDLKTKILNELLNDQEIRLSNNEETIKQRANFIINKYIMKFDCISHYDKVRDELISNLLKGMN